MTPSSKHQLPKTALVTAGAAVLAAAVLLAVFRAEASAYLWQKHRLFPEAAFFFNHGNAAMALNIANHYFGGGAYDLEKAEQYYLKALRADPKAPLAWYQLGRIDFLRGDFASAITSLNRQEKLHGDAIPNVYYMKGLVYGYAQNYARAEEHFQTFLEYEPESWAAHNDLAWVYFSEGRYQEAADAAKAGLRYHPDNPWLLLSYGTALLNLGETAKARQMLLRAREQAKTLTESDWLAAYPGNDPRLAGKGLAHMQETIAENLAQLQARETEGGD